MDGKRPAENERSVSVKIPVDLVQSKHFQKCKHATVKNIGLLLLVLKILERYSIDWTPRVPVVDARWDNQTCSLDDWVAYFLNGFKTHVSRILTFRPWGAQLGRPIGRGVPLSCHNSEPNGHNGKFLEEKTKTMVN